MMRRALAFLVALAAMASPLALAQDEKPLALPPAGAHDATVGNATLAYWVSPGPGFVKESIDLGEHAAIWFGLVGANDTRLVVHLNVTPTSATLSLSNASFTLDAAPRGFALANATVAPTVADAGRVNMTYSFSAQVYEEQNGTLVLLGPVSGEGAFTYDVGAFVPAPPAPGVPTTWLLVGAAVLVVGGIGGAVAMRQRAVKRRMNEGPRRSQVMREMEIEEKLEKAKAKDPEAAVVIQQEIRQAEKVRENRRELQILEAKRADALKTIDLLRKRHEAGGLTRLQYDNMVAKKQADLERIEAEIAQMQGDETGAAA